ncbi:MAG: ribosome-associated translation inhibitor RaiA [Steroidobacteraceae bacterium]|jgi:ribosome-associated translation inhibitor RaiA|nr:ribosome-associated translation inhibitor RaiA [Steroidobacteraceae bacterium]
MTFPLQITFRHMPPSRIFENRIRELARRLERFSDRITHCHVVIEQPHQHNTQGSVFDVHITVTVPGEVIAINRSHAQDPRHTDAYVALRDAFSAAKRKLQEHERSSQAFAHTG